MGMNFCTANGPRGLLLIPQFAVMREKSGIVLNLFEASKAVTQTPSGKALIIRQSSDYPVSGLVQIRLQLKQKERFTVKIRIPAWSDSTRLTINDREEVQPAAGAYHLIDRLWKDNDLICLTLDLRPRWQQRPADHHHHLAVMRGPLVLARDQRWDLGDVDEPAKPHQEQSALVFASDHDAAGLLFLLHRILCAGGLSGKGIRQAAEPHPGRLRFRGQHVEPGITVPGVVAVGLESHGTVKPLHQIKV